jgi:hypothetical protein
MGQLVAYGLNDSGEIANINTEDQTTTFASKDIEIKSIIVLKADNIYYSISPDVAVFTYTGNDPEESEITFGTSDIDSINEDDPGTSSSNLPIKIYFNSENHVVAILVPKNRVKD